MSLFQKTKVIGTNLVDKVLFYIALIYFDEVWLLWESGP